jgi:hypothetical protein
MVNDNSGSWGVTVGRAGSRGTIHGSRGSIRLSNCRLLNTVARSRGTITRLRSTVSGLRRIAARSGGTVSGLLRITTGSGGAITRLLRITTGSRGSITRLLRVAARSGGTIARLLRITTRSGGTVTRLGRVATRSRGTITSLNSCLLDTVSGGRSRGGVSTRSRVSTGGRGTSLGNSGHLLNTTRLTEINGTNRNVKISTALSCQSQGQPEILLNTGEEASEVDVSLSQSIILTDGIVIINDDTNTILIWVVGLHAENLVPDGVERLADDTGLVDLVTIIVERVAGQKYARKGRKMRSKSGTDLQ